MWILTVRIFWILLIFGNSSQSRNSINDTHENYLGCYQDSGNRLLGGLQQDFPKTLTEHICIQFCFDKGFAFAGTAFSHQCFCSINRPPDDKKVPADQCNAKCAGNKEKTCGGTWKISVYRTGFIPIKGSDAKENYLGCYIDAGNRLLGGLQTEFPGTLTQNICNRFCLDKGFAFAGTEFSFQCFCSMNSPPDDKKTIDGQCDSKCAGNKEKICGGFWRLSVYSTGFIPVDEYSDVQGNYLGCYIDAGNRLLGGLHKDFPESLTQNICNLFCREKGFAFAGTEHSVQCFCSMNRPPDDKKAPDGQCNMKCAGNNENICGGIWRLSVYSTRFIQIENSDVQGNHLGCYTDANNRLLDGLHKDFPLTLTQNICNLFCFDKGFEFAGTEFSVQCFCSRNIPPDNKKLPAAQCDSKCTGDSEKICGGFWKLSVYRTGFISSEKSDAQNQYLGCFADAGNRLLGGLQQDFPLTLTRNICNVFCRDKGFAFAGTEHSLQCFCSINRPLDDKKVPDDQCDAKCAGNRDVICGGLWKISVYSTALAFAPIEGSDALENYLGCYIDSGNRLLGGLQQDFPGTLTQNICNQFCLDKGFAYAGTEFSYQCFCSMNRPPDDKKISDDQCNSKCAGNSEKICGGLWKVSVYSTEAIPLLRAGHLD